MRCLCREGTRHWNDRRVSLLLFRASRRAGRHHCDGSLRHSGLERPAGPDLIAFPGESPDYVSLEGYLAGSVLVEGLRRSGSQLDTERLVDTLENLRDLDLGLGTPVTFGRTEHQALHKVWGTELNATGHYQSIDLE